MFSPLTLTIGLVLAAASTFCLTEDKIDFTNFKAGDPLPLADLFVFENNSGLAQYSLNLTESTITGLDQPSRIQRSKLTDEVTYSYDWLELDGQYAQDGRLISVLPAFGKGDYHVEASDIAITVNSTVPLHVNDWFFYVNDVNATFQDYLGGGLMAVVGQLFEPALGIRAFKLFEPQIRDILDSLQEKNMLK